MTTEKKYDKPLLTLNCADHKWIVHEGHWVSDNGEMILMTDGNPSRQIVGSGRVVFAVHLLDMYLAMEKELRALK
jgi:hypothetical protein